MRPHFVLLLGLLPASLLAAEPLPRTVAEGATLVEVYADDRLFEGPTWDPAGKKLYFCSVSKDNSQLLRLEAPGKASVFADKTDSVYGTFLGFDGRLLAAQARGHRILTYDLKTAQIEV